MGYLNTAKNKVSFPSWFATLFWCLIGTVFQFSSCSCCNFVDAFVTNGSLYHGQWKPSKMTSLHSTTSSEKEDDNNQQWKEELLNLCKRTKGGFEATVQDRNEMKRLINQQQQQKKDDSNIKIAIQEYYEEKDTSFLRGKWDLLYTDAPDILSLQTSSSSSVLPFLPSINDMNPLAPQLGRIGQDCTNPPFIENIIEWKKPTSTSNNNIFAVPSSLFPERILQKVSCRGTYTNNKNNKLDNNQVNLSILGARFEIPSSSSSSSSPPTPPTPLITLPFGSFQILYIDSEIRITKTSQNYYAINRRSKDPWF